MKRMKRTLALLAALAALLASLSLPALAEEGERVFLLDCDEEFMPAYHINGDAGGKVPDEQAFLRLRMKALADTCGFDLYVGCMSAPAWMGASSFDAYRESFFAENPGALGDSAACILYDEESGGTFVHVGSSVAESCDTASIEAALLDTGTDRYNKMVNALNALQNAIGRARTPLLLCESEHYDRVQKNLEPLREKFPGLVYVIYESTAPEEAEYERRADYYASLYTMYRMDSLLPDAICIFFYRNTGDVFIGVGDQTGLYVGDMDAVEDAFTSTPGPRNYIGFGSGVEALARNLVAGQEIPDYVAPVLLGTAAAVLALALGIEAIARKRGRPLTMESTGK